MNRLTFPLQNGIDVKYSSSASMEELVERLAKYENTGYEPEELKEAVILKPNKEWLDERNGTATPRYHTISISDVNSNPSVGELEGTLAVEHAKRFFSRNGTTGEHTNAIATCAHESILAATELDSTPKGKDDL